MNELAKHIEVLLLENDCVIVPGLGGFIAHYRPAYIAPQDGKCYPPSRTIGFNPQLTINDGLLTQSYMQTYHTDFPDAARKIEKVVVSIKDMLYREGAFCLPHVGTLYNNVQGHYEFKPGDNGFFTPSLYGLGACLLPTLVRQAEPEAHSSVFIPEDQPETIVSVPVSQPLSQKPASFWKYAVSIAAAIFLFFVFSSKVENTEINHSVYASIGTSSMIEEIRQSSLMFHLPETSERSAVKTIEKETQNAHTAPTMEVKTAENKIQQTAHIEESLPYAVVIASLRTLKGAETQLKMLEKQGYTGLTIISSPRIHRISIGNYRTEEEAYHAANKLRKDPNLSAAWVYKQS